MDQAKTERNCIVCNVPVGKEALINVTKASYGPHAVEGPAHRRCLDERGIEPVWAKDLRKRADRGMRTIWIGVAVVLGVIAVCLYYVFVAPHG
jgi:hypothetical protein